MAGAASHAVDGINDRCSGDGRVLSAKTMNGLIEWERRQMSFCRRSNQGFGERQTSAAGRWLQDDVDILRSTEPMREMDVPGAFRETGHVVAVGAQLFRNGRMRNDDAWNCGSVIRPDENGRGGSGISTVVHRDAQERRDGARDGRHQRGGRLCDGEGGTRTKAGDRWQYRPSSRYRHAQKKAVERDHTFPRVDEAEWDLGHRRGGQFRMQGARASRQQR